MAGPIAASQDSFLERLKVGRLPAPAAHRTFSDAGISGRQLVEIFESQIISRRLDLEARRLGAEKRGFYSIGSAGHEGNACVARVMRATDMAFLHYRSGAFYIERARKVPGETPIWNMALSFVASSDDPISGGRHKVIGSKALAIPPQTSTIASHLPKAVGMAFSIGLSRKLRKSDCTAPHDSVVICSFGDASANHSTAQGAINSAAYTSFRGLPMPLVFICEDNGLGISVPTPENWIKASYSARLGLNYVYGDARDPIDAICAAREAERIARTLKRPVFCHLRTVRLMGHAGSDLESGYRDRLEIEREADGDPLLHTARRLIENGVLSRDDVENFYAEITARAHRVMEAACSRPRLTSAQEVSQSIIPPRRQKAPRAAKQAPGAPDDKRARKEPQHMSRLISLALAEQLAHDSDVVVFGEDVGKKGGVYGATTRLQRKFGPARVFDTLLDEQSILGMAIGLAQNGFIPCPEIQFLAYVHNAEDQIRGEAATLSFFSNGQFANPMVIRIAGLGYQKGFGGHFHNDNSLAVFRDIPGIILACPSTGADAVRIHREAFRLAREENRITIVIEPIALYGVKDLYEAGDGLMSAAFDDIDGEAPFGEPAIIGDGKDIAIITYGNGVYLSRRACAGLAKSGVKSRIIDLRWLSPLPADKIAKAVEPCKNVLIVDECRKTGSPSEEIMTALAEHDCRARIKRIAGEDCFIPLGPAADEVLLSEAQIVSAAMSLIEKSNKRAAE